MLIAAEGKVVNVRQLTETGFCELTFTDILTGSQKATGSDLMYLKPGEQVVFVGKEEIKKKFGPQTKIVRLWLKNSCPFTDLQAARKTIAFLHDEIKLPPAIAQRVFDAYLADAEAVIRENPYRLATEGLVRRMNVATVDKYIAPHFQIPLTDKRRLKAHVISTIRAAKSLYGIAPFVDETTGQVFGHAGGGHVYTDFSQIVGTAAEEMGLDRKTVSMEVRRMAAEPRHPFSKKPLIVVERDQKEDRDKFVYSHALFTAEKGLAHHVKRILGSSPQDLSLLDIISPELTLSAEQEEAVKMALSSALSIITGGPGVGKTTIIKALTSTLDNANIRYALCAPTGVAARRMVKATGKPASTIHRTLQVDPVAGCFRHDRKNPLPEAVIICDECSMIDIGLMFSLFDAVRFGATVILVGDADQLPPVGPGSPFRDLVGWGKIPTTRLNEVRRQELSDSLIIKGSRSILAKQLPEFSAQPPVGDLYAFPYINESQALKIVTDLAVEKITKTFGIARDGIQILCPHKRAKRKQKKDGEESLKILASENVNLVIQQRLNAAKKDDLPLDAKFFVGDRVIHTRNNYDLDVMNGEIGYVRQVNVREHKSVRRVSYQVEYDDGKKVAYDDKDAMQLELAYALSVHKCVHPNTIVETPDGLIPIKEIHENGIIAAAGGSESYSGLVTNAESKLIKIETDDGYEAIVTPDHHAYAWDGKAFSKIRADHLKEGAVLRLRLGQTCEILEAPTLPVAPSVDPRARIFSLPKKLDPRVAEFLGLMVADGTLYERGFRLAKRHHDVTERFALLCNAIFGASPSVWQENNALQAEVSSTFLSRWLKTIGGMEPNAKKIPDCILRSPLQCQAAFLRGLFEDGTVNEKKSILDHIEWSNSSPELSQVVQTMLLRFGIISARIRRNGSQSFIYIYGANAHRFRDQIGFVSQFKNDRLQLPTGRETRYTIPISSGEADELKMFLSKSDAGNVNTRGYISRAKAHDLIEVGANGALIVEKLRWHYSAVKTISPQPSGPSMCVSVPKGRRFLQNGFDFGNSQGSEFQATIILAYHSGNFFSRNMLYTALTRGKRLVCVVSPKGSVSFKKILNVDETTRASRLIWRIENEYGRDDEFDSLSLDELSESEEA